MFEVGGFDLLTSVDKILVTHLHFDHTIGLPDLWLSGWLYGRRTPLEVYGPDGMKSMMSSFEKAFTWDLKYRKVIGVPQEGLEVISHEVKPGVFFEENGLKISVFPVEHMPVNPDTQELLDLEGQTYGFRIDYKNRSVVFSGDTKSTETSELIKYSKDVDVLIHEVEVPSTNSSISVSQTVHSTPAQAAFVFNQTRPRMAVYTHIVPPQTPDEQIISLTAKAYKGPLVVAHDFMTITIGEEIVVGERAKMKNDVFKTSLSSEK